MDFNKNIVVTGSFIMAVTIAIGAFGAHSLKELLDAASLNTFEVGVRYQMYHALAILFLGSAPAIPKTIRIRVFWFFIFGILFFSGSIYLLSIEFLLPFETTSFGYLTPVGGLLFIIGWFYLAYGVLTLKKQ